MKLELPVASKGLIWNGKQDEFNNLDVRMDYSQEFGLTPYAKTGVYGTYNGKPRPHNGHDFAGKADLIAPIDCKITYIGYDHDGYGNFLFFEAEGFEFVLAHFEKIIVGLGNYGVGNVFGKMGNTGMSTGVHTHFGGRPIGANKNNATRGYVDLTEYFKIKPVYNKQTLIDMANKYNLKLIRNTRTGEMGYFYDNFLRTATTEDRATLMLMTYIHRNYDGINISDNEWNQLPKKQF